MSEIVKVGNVIDEVLSDWMQSIGSKIRRRRCDFCISQKGLAEMAGVCRSTVIDIEAGKPFLVDKLKLIADALGIAPCDLL